MSSSIYTRLAFTNLKNNRKTYIPYILTAALTVMMYYVIDALSKTGSIRAASVKSILSYAVNVMVIFAVIFLFYTNSFLIKRRKKEIGIYNILGMGKSHIAKMLLIETLVTAVVSIGAGMAAGVVFSKLVWLILLKLLCYDIGMDFEIVGRSLINTLVLFGIIFLLTLIYNLLQIRLANPIELLRGTNQGEREPRTKWLLTLFGIAMIGCGYYIALTTEKPLAAIQMFFVAVVCVILGTYALFIAGSIALLKMLKKNKRFYYKANHFTAVSGMIYRMKQNAVGLANICILSTMVLVMISSTCSLYFGMEDILRTRFPQEFEIDIYDTDKEREDKIHTIIQEETKSAGVRTESENAYHCGVATILKKGNKFILADDNAVYSETSNAYGIYMLSVDDYNRLENDSVALDEDEVLIYTPEEDAPKIGNIIRIEQDTYKVVKELDNMSIERKVSSSSIGTYYVIFKDEGHIEKYLEAVRQRLKKEGGTDAEMKMLRILYRIRFDLEGEEESCSLATKKIQKRVKEEVPDTYCTGRELNRRSFYEVYGGLLFIGIYLGIMFLMATVLIMYYKQISEGYEDKERYQIMQKVGMSKREVRRSIASQVLIIFFLPLIVTIVHIAVAFKVITKLLAVLSLVNVPLFFVCTVITAAVFAAFYALIFMLTAREYYKIVN